MPLKILGPSYPPGDNVAATLGYVNDQWVGNSGHGVTPLEVDPTYVTTTTTALAATLANVTDVDTADSAHGLKTDVDAADTAYIARTTIGVAGGPVPLNGSVQVDTSYVPSTMPTARVVYAAPAAVWTLTTTALCNAAPGSNIKEFAAASITIADPGYPWIPWVDGQVAGAASGVVTSGVAAALTDPGNGFGCGVWAQGAVIDTAGNLWARVITGSNFRPYVYPLQPFANSSATPLTLTGPTVLTFYLSLFSRTDSGNNSYTFTRTGSLFNALVMGGL